MRGALEAPGRVAVPPAAGRGTAKCCLDCNGLVYVTGKVGSDDFGTDQVGDWKQHGGLDSLNRNITSIFRKTCDTQAHSMIHFTCGGLCVCADRQQPSFVPSGVRRRQRARRLRVPRVHVRSLTPVLGAYAMLRGITRNYAELRETPVPETQLPRADPCLERGRALKTQRDTRFLRARARNRVRTATLSGLSRTPRRDGIGSPPRAAFAHDTSRSRSRS